MELNKKEEKKDNEKKDEKKNVKEDSQNKNNEEKEKKSSDKMSDSETLNNLFGPIISSEPNFQNSFALKNPTQSEGQSFGSFSRLQNIGENNPQFLNDNLNSINNDETQNTLKSNIVQTTDKTSSK